MPDKGNKGNDRDDDRRPCLKSQNSTNAVGGLLIRHLLSLVPGKFWESHRPQSLDGSYLTWKRSIALVS
jgi:hypothetical protein